MIRKTHKVKPDGSLDLGLLGLKPGSSVLVSVQPTGSRAKKRKSSFLETALKTKVEGPSDWSKTSTPICMAGAKRAEFFLDSNFAIALTNDEHFEQAGFKALLRD